MPVELISAKSVLTVNNLSPSFGIVNVPVKVEVAFLLLPVKIASPICVPAELSHKVTLTMSLGDDDADGLVNCKETFCKFIDSLLAWNLRIALVLPVVFARQIIGRTGRIQGNCEATRADSHSSGTLAVAVMEADWLDVTPVLAPAGPRTGIPNKKVELVVAEPAILHLRAIVLTVPLGIVKFGIKRESRSDRRSGNCVSQCSKRLNRHTAYSR